MFKIIDMVIYPTKKHQGVTTLSDLSVTLKCRKISDGGIHDLPISDMKFLVNNCNVTPKRKRAYQYNQISLNG